MKPISIISLLLMLLTFQTVLAQSGKITGGASYEVPGWFKNSFLEIADDVDEANQSGKHVLLFFHLDGCPYCKKMLTEDFEKEPLKSQIQQHFDSIGINIRGDREIVMSKNLTTTERVLSSYLKIKYTPTILFLDRHNKTVLRLNGYRSPQAMKQALDFVQSNAYLKTSFSEYKRQHMQSAGYRFIDDPLFRDIRDFSAIKTPVAVIFEDNACNECADFHHKMLSRKEIRRQLSHYQVVRLDAKSDRPIIDFEGHKTTPRAWADRLSMSYRPGLVLFDNGKEVARVESMLYPFHFEHVLRFGLNKNYQKYPNYLALMAMRQRQLMAQGIDVNIGKPADW